MSGDLKEHLELCEPEIGAQVCATLGERHERDVNFDPKDASGYQLGLLRYDDPPVVLER